MVLSPSYEGGHPDHDTAAFAVARLRQGGLRFEHREFPLYHAAEGGEMISGEFLGGANAETLQLTPGEQSLKSQMLACFTTQQQILSEFRLDSESFRAAPNYDFTQPPHPGPLLYERWGWDISGEAWRDKIRESISSVGMGL
jgi:LmbE family N-acetylglucosaminyl deacetylase